MGLRNLGRLWHEMNINEKEGQQAGESGGKRASTSLPFSSACFANTPWIMTCPHGQADRNSRVALAGEWPVLVARLNLPGPNSVPARGALLNWLLCAFGISFSHCRQLLQKIANGQY